MKAYTDIIGEAFKKMHDQQSRRGNGMRELEESNFKKRPGYKSYSTQTERKGKSL